jgi:hypothetical protein
VQGRLRGEKVSAVIATYCEHCHRKLHSAVDSEFCWEVKEKESRPLLFEPDTDWRSFKGAKIINDY